jgi:hypothetical protein
VSWVPPSYRKIEPLQMERDPLHIIEIFKICVGILVSLGTLFISWKTFQLNEQASQNNSQLEQIQHQLSETRFDYERILDIYDRTEKYLSLITSGKLIHDPGLKWTKRRIRFTKRMCSAFLRFI